MRITILEKCLDWFFYHCKDPTLIKSTLSPPFLSAVEILILLTFLVFGQVYRCEVKACRDIETKSDPTMTEVFRYLKYLGRTSPSELLISVSN